ncbi:MAG: translocation/assembly module TamB [Sphingobacteriales bacterium]|nr:MAG: translocation/assembly module TamB [Sphingobacteriales bacterium]
MKRALRITLYILGGIFVLLLGIVVWLNTGSGKNFLKNKAVAFIEKKLNTEVIVGTLDYRLPEMVELKDVLFRDQAKDTMLAVRRLRVDINMLKLLSNKVEVEEIVMEGGVMHLYRNAPDTSFNFDYVAKAFAAPPNPNAQDAPTDSTGQLQLDIKRLLLDDIRVRFNDYTGGSHFVTDLNKLELTLNKLDPYNLDFNAKTLYVDGARIHFTLNPSLLPPTDSAVVVMPLLAADELNLRNVIFRFEDNVNPMQMEYQVGALLAHPERIDLRNQYIGIKDLIVDTSNIQIAMGRAAAEKAGQLLDTLINVNAAPAAKWYVDANTVQFTKVSLQFDNHSVKRLPEGIDFAHLDAKDIDLDINDFHYTTDTIMGDIQHFAAVEKSGLIIQELKTVFAYHPQGVYLRNLYAQTPQTVLRDYAELRYPSLEALTNSPETMYTRLHLTNSVVGMRDVLIFAPNLKSQPLFRTYANDRLKVNAVAEGFLNALEIDRFILQGLNSYVDISGKVNGLPDPNKVNYNLSIARLQTNKAVVNTFLTPAIQKQVNIPNSFTITGRINGTTTSFNTDLYATTTDGDAKINGTLSLGSKPGREKYNMVVRTDKLNIGKIIRQEKTIGRVSANISAIGQSFDVNYMDAMLKGHISSAGFMGYNYSNIDFNAKVANKSAAYNIVSKDPNAVLNAKGTANFANKYPAIVARIDIDSIDLQALKLYQDELRIRGVVDANIPVLSPDYPRGTVTMDRPTVVLKGQRYFLDSMYVASTPSADSGNYIVINADAIQAVISGRTPLTQIGNIVNSHINRYYATNTGDSIRAVRAAPSSYDLSVNAILRDRPLLRVLIPGLEAMDTVRLEAGLSPNTLFVNANMPRLQYNGMVFQNGLARINGGADSGLNYNITLDRFTQGSMDFQYASVSGNLYRQNLLARVRIADSSRNPRFGITANMRMAGANQELTVQEGLLLNYKTWDVTQPNKIVFGKDGFYVQNFRISSGGESISLNSETPQFSAPIAVAIKDFLISNVTEIISKDTLLANGVLNGNLTLRNVMKAPEVAGNFDIRDLSVLNDTVGNVAAQLNSASANAIDSRVNITGRGNDVSVTGLYYPQAVNGNNFDLNINIAALNLVSIEGITSYAVRNSVGYLRGNLKLQGTMAAPRMTGELRTDNLSTTIAALGTRYRMPAEVVRFTGDAVEFQNFKLLDSAGNQAIVDGKIYTRDFKNMELALRVRANRWLAINSTAKDNDLFYGRAIVSANLNIGGSILAPSMSGNLTVHDSTKLSVVVPQPTPGIEEREGVVEFVDMSDPNRYKLLPPKDTTKKLALRTGTNINLNVNVEKDAEFNVIIDEASGDFVRVRGQAALNTYVSPDGVLGIVGSYELKSGSYELNYNFIRRRFDIQPGSSITFAGDPMDAILNVTAAYTANIPPYDLVAQQVSDPAQLVYFRQRLPFQVQLKLTGPMMKPNVTFDIVLPEDRTFRATPDVVNLTEARLAEVRNNASEINKQVFAVLILGRFIGESPFRSGVDGGGAGLYAKQSASRFISDQLNQLSDKLAGGINLNFDLQTSEDYTTGQRRERTDLNVSASRRLLNDRLKVTFGNNFELGDGTQTNSNNNSNLIPSNLALDYLLTANGRYTIRLYREQDNTEIIDRSVIETGAAFIMRAEYNKFRQLLTNKRRMRRNNMREMQWKENPIDSNKQTTARTKP